MIRWLLEGVVIGVVLFLWVVLMSAIFMLIFTATSGGLA
jgi:hypothetical protein